MTTLVRLPDWPLRMERAINEARGKSFEWGSYDCALFVADVIKAITGEDLAKVFRSAYDTRVGAASIVRHFGGLSEVADAYLERVDPPRARRGDVLLMPQRRWRAFGVCLGRHAAVAGRQGVVFLDRSFALAAWKVGV